MLRQALAELPDEFREAIVLRELEGLSYKEIAAVTGAPIGTVMSRLARGASGCKRNWTGAGPRGIDVTCEEIRDLLSPYADGELDLVRSLEIERHLPGCPACAAGLEGLRSLRVRLADPALYYQPSAALAARLRSSSRSAVFPWRRVGMAAAAALLVAAALWGIVRGLSAPSAEELLAREVVGGHVRSLMAEHLLDFPSDNRHEIKPWFLGRVDVAPEVKDLKEEHFPIVGARLDYIDGRPTAVLVYKRNAHVINVFVWKETGRDRGTVFLERQGYHLAHWNDNERAFWVVSDLNEAELRQFVELFRR